MGSQGDLSGGLLQGLKQGNHQEDGKKGRLQRYVKEDRMDKEGSVIASRLLVWATAEVQVRVVPLSTTGADVQFKTCGASM